MIYIYIYYLISFDIIQFISQAGGGPKSTRYGRIVRSLGIGGRSSFSIAQIDWGIQGGDVLQIADRGRVFIPHTTDFTDFGLFLS